MRPLNLLAASALALTAAACGPRVPEARAALDCPPTQGELKRTSVSATACTYSGSDGAEVTLQLVSTASGVDTALAAIETNLLAGRIAKAETEKGEPAEVKPEAGKEAAQAAKEASEDTKAAGLNVNVDTEGKDVVVEMKDGKVVTSERKSDGDGTVRVNLPGIHVVANENDDSAEVRVGPIHINAGGDKMGVHIRREVRLRGEALNPERRGIRATFIYTGDDLPDGYRLVGYEAGGPKRGPITVAVVKSKTENHDGTELYPDVQKLVRKNGGV